MKTTNTIKATKRSKVTNISDMSKERLFNLTMQNCQKIGNKVFVFIPMELLFVDARFQRVSESSKTKIRNLTNCWDDNKMDALKVSVHPEANEFSIIDGYHRFTAGKTKGFNGFSCELIQGLSENPEERIIQEATLFATQNDEVDILSPVEKHKANVLRGVTENIVLQDIINKYNIPLKTNPSHGKVKIGHLAGYTCALRIAKVYGEEMLDDIFYIICESRWNIAARGLSANVITSVANMLKFHPSHREEIKSELIKYFKPIEPDKFLASAMDKYPERKEKERLSLFLEDHLCEQIGMERTYIHHSTSKISLKETA